MSVDSLHAALRAKYRTSTDAMRALGLNPNLLHDERTKPMVRRAQDRRFRRFGGDAEMMSVPDAMEAIRQILENCEDPDALAVAFTDQLSASNGIGEPEPEAGSREAEDRRRRAMGLDSRRHPRPDEERAFLGRFKDAGRIQVM